jgi:5-methylcytosine-specific restriction endonuclease McrA
MNRKRKEIKPLNGSKWIRKAKRQAIYIRDNGKCAYCGRDHSLTLDHITPRVFWGKNDQTNLITACVNCNSKRKEQKVVDFLRAEGYDTKTITEIVAVINKNRRQIIR